MRKVKIRTILSQPLSSEEDDLNSGLSILEGCGVREEDIISIIPNKSGMSRLSYKVYFWQPRISNDTGNRKA